MSRKYRLFLEYSDGAVEEIFKDFDSAEEAWKACDEVIVEKQQLGLPLPVDTMVVEFSVKEAK